MRRNACDGCGKTALFGCCVGCLFPYQLCGMCLQPGCAEAVVTDCSVTHGADLAGACSAATGNNAEGSGAESFCTPENGVRGACGLCSYCCAWGCGAKCGRKMCLQGRQLQEEYFSHNLPVAVGVVAGGGGAAGASLGGQQQQQQEHAAQVRSERERLQSEAFAGSFGGWAPHTFRAVSFCSAVPGDARARAVWGEGWLFPDLKNVELKKKELERLCERMAEVQITQLPEALK
eukprot:g12360.t1